METFQSIILCSKCIYRHLFSGYDSQVFCCILCDYIALHVSRLMCVFVYVHAYTEVCFYTFSMFESHELSCDERK